MSSSILSPRPLGSDLAALLLRLIFGGMFIYFGYGKIAAYDDILPMFEGYLGMSPKLSFHMVIFAEFGCGILVALGLLTRLSVIPIFITMIVAFFVAHADDPFTAKHSSFEFMLYSVVVFVLGSGKYSIDALLFKK